MSKLQAQIKEEKEEKRRKTLEVKLLNVQESFVSCLDSAARMTRCLDAAPRLLLRDGAMHKEKSEALDAARASLSIITSSTKSLLPLQFTDQQESKGYALYKREQTNLEQHARRLQGSVARYNAEEKK